MNASLETPVSTAALAGLKRRVAGWSIAATVIVTALKLVAGLVSGSLALLADAAHGLLDIGATTLTFFAVRQADRPADEDHHYGHGKIEAVAALCESTLLALLALAAFVEAVRRLAFEPGTTLFASPFAFAAVAISICIDATRWRILHVVARDTGSEALAADALHFSSDSRPRSRSSSGSRRPRRATPTPMPRRRSSSRCSSPLRRRGSRSE